MFDIQHFADKLFSVHEAERPVRCLFFGIGLDGVRLNVRSADRYRDRSSGMGTETQGNRMIRQNRKRDIASGKSRHDRLDDFIFET